MTTDRTCVWCAGDIPPGTPYICWLFSRCAYCNREMTRHHDATNAPGVPPRW